MENQNNDLQQPKKRVSPFDAPLKQAAKAVSKVEQENKAKETTKKAESKKEVAKKAPAKKEEKPATKKTPAKKAEPKKDVAKKAPAKTTTKKEAAKKPVAKATTKKPKIDESKITSVKIDPRTGTIKQTKPAKPKVEPKEEQKPVVKKQDKPKAKRPTIKSKDVTIEPAPRDNTPKEIVRPTPKKTKQLTKEEKVLYKNLEEAFNFVGNMTTVIEERTMDKSIEDLTIGELHVIEMVNKYNNKPMTLIAKKLHVTVGSLTIGVNRLVQKGYLLRIRDEMDRRVILLSVTPQGKKVLKAHDKFHEDILGLVLDNIQLQQAVKVMTQFANVLEMYYDPSIIETQENKTKKGR